MENTTHDRPRISVIIPSYNVAEFIGETIQSILDQQYPNLECIVIDGGSTDGTLDILRRYDGQITWISEPDRGQSDAINKGLRRATGDIVCYICADDCYEKDCFARVADFFAGNPEVMWASGRCTIVDDRGREIRRPITRYRTFWQRRYSYNRLLVLDFIPQPAAFWRRELVDEIGFFDVDEHLAMDYEYWLRAGARYDPGFIDARLARFRIHPHSKSSTSFARQAREALAIARRYARAGGRNYIAPLQYLHYLLVLTGYSVLYFLSRPAKKEGALVL